MFFVKRLKDHCSLQPSAEVKTPLFGQRMYAATAGNMCATKDLFVEAADLALRGKSAEISGVHFKQAFERIQIARALVPEGLNPFTMTEDSLALSRKRR